jgi:hypothetical protein
VRLRPTRRYLHFLGALAAGCGAAFVAALPAILMSGMPGNEVILWRKVRWAADWGAVAATLVFLAAGWQAPLHARPWIAVPAALLAWLGFLALANHAARTAWLTGDGAIALTLLVVAALGYLPFRLASRS